MKKATSETRIRITLNFPITGQQTITLDASAWNELSSMLFDASRHRESLGLEVLADDSREMADRIFHVLDAHKYYD